MSDSFAGITVPEGEPGTLRSAASRLHGVAGGLEGVSGRLRGSPGMLSSWSGPASVSYAGSCLTNGAAASAGTALPAKEPAVGALGQVAAGLREHWRVDALWAGRGDGVSGRSVEVLDTRDGLWLIAPADAQVELAHVRPSEVFRRLCGLLPSDEELAEGA